MFRPLTPEGKAWWKRRLLDPLVIAFATSVVLLVVLVVLLGVRMVQNRREMMLLRIELAAHLKDREAKDQQWRGEFDTIYRTLYAPPDQNDKAPRQPSQVELWQRNRDRELRDRIGRLEQWRLREERER